MVCKGRPSQFMPTWQQTSALLKYYWADSDLWPHCGMGSIRKFPCRDENVLLGSNQQTTHKKEAESEQALALCWIFCHASAVNHFHTVHVGWFCVLFRSRDLRHEIVHIFSVFSFYNSSTTNATTSTKGKHEKWRSKGNNASFSAKGMETESEARERM